MGLFNADLYRSFGIGFALGTLVLTGAMVAQGRAHVSGQVIPSAQGAPALPDQTR